MELVFAVLNLLGLGGLAAFIYWTYRGLQERIKNLTQLAQEQKETLEAVRTRATELDQLRKDYRQGLEDFQHLGEKIKAKRDELEGEYQAALQRKDEQLAKAKALELKDLELKEQSLQLVPELQSRLTTTVEQLQLQIETLSSVLEPRRRTRSAHIFSGIVLETQLRQLEAQEELIRLDAHNVSRKLEPFFERLAALPTLETPTAEAKKEPER